MAEAATVVTVVLGEFELGVGAALSLWSPSSNHQLPPIPQSPPTRPQSLTCRDVDSPPPKHKTSAYPILKPNSPERILDQQLAPGYGC